MSYRSVDSEAYKKAYANKNKKKKSKAKKVLKDEKGTFEWEGVRGRRKKKYLTSFSDTQAKAKKSTTSNKAYGTTFKSAFADARKGGKDKFTWQGKSYHTKTKSELEGAKEKERFARAGKSKETTKKKGFFAKLKSLGSPAKGREERVKAKRIAWMEKRKEAGKSYSAKNLASLKGDTGAKKTLITKKDKKKPSIGLVR